MTRIDRAMEVRKKLGYKDISKQEVIDILCPGLHIESWPTAFGFGCIRDCEKCWNQEVPEDDKD